MKPIALSALQLFLVVVGAGGLASAESPGGDGSVEWTSLFDGASLDGWNASESPDSFRVVDGAIVVHGPRGHLYYVGRVNKGRFRNFELELEVRTSAGANSGVYFHTRPQESGWPAWGYEAQVNSTHGDAIKTGSLYNVVNVNPSPSRDDKWFRYRIRVDGRRISTWVDDQVTVDWLEPPGVTGTRRLGQGTFALQAHDPESTVLYRNIRVRVLPDEPTPLTRAELVAFRQTDRWWERMDYGPFVSATVGLPGSDNVALKGITVELSPARDVSVTFDTELLRMAFGWEGWLSLKGVTYDGSHGGHPLAAGNVVFATPPTPGWGVDGDFTDPRPIPYGPLPRDRARYRGLYRHAEQTIFEYTVGDTTVLEMPALEVAGEAEVITRSFEIDAATRELQMIVAAEPGREVAVQDGGHGAVAQAAVAATIPDAESAADEVLVIVDRVPDESSWSRLAMGSPSNADLADQASGEDVAFRWVEGFAPPHPRAGGEGALLPRLNDGLRATNSDDTAGNTWLDGDRARWVADLGEERAVTRINTYSWHRTNRAPQKLTLWGATGDASDPREDDLASAGWTRIADIDTSGFGFGGKHGSCVTNLKGIVGRYRTLLWDMPALQGREGMFISEIDVFTDDQELPSLREPTSKDDSRSLAVALLGAPDGVRLAAGEGGTILLRVPAGTPACTFKLALTRALENADLDPLRRLLSPATPLRPLTRGGPSLYPETLELPCSRAPDEAPYVVDQIPIPFENPWGSFMRASAFDFFADGERAAVCTWNGDVWIVGGLGDASEQVTWRRFATGLFETLGLRIVDDVVYVHGKDQITRLHDLDGDGEADRYECFNNDVYVTRNFHEFPFDLQTDAEGNFYISKAAPVRGGGRGFEEITPHHGTVMKISPDGQNLEVYARGMRAPNGIGVAPDGQVTAGDNEGTWVPHCKLHWLSPGSFQGVVPVAGTEEPPEHYNPPLCWFPMEVDNSSGGQVWVTGDSWGPFSGQMLHLSYGQSAVYVVMKEALHSGMVQGGVVRLPVNLSSSAMRGRFNAVDGQLYVVGLRGWQTNAVNLAGFQRIRYTGQPVAMPIGLHVIEGGIRIGFTCELDRELAEDPESYAISQWNYVWGPMYGSPEISARDPDPELVELAMKTEQRVQQHDSVEVKSARLEADGRTVVLEIPELMPVMQMHIKTDLEGVDGQELAFDIYNTINEVPGDR